MYEVLQQKLRARPRAIAKLLLIMRLTTLILITGILQVSASTFAQKVSLSERNAPLDMVLDRIRIQTGYDFLYRSVNTKNLQNISIQVRDTELQDVLKRILNPQNLDFEIDDKSVIIKIREEPSFLDKLVARFQEIDVRGRILDEKGSPLPNASIRIKGKSTVTNTNEKGEFFISGAQPDAILQISYIGYKTLEIPLKDAKLPLEIRLSIQTGELEQVEVVYNTGYQKIRPEQSTGSIATLSAKEFNTRINTTNFLTGLQNKIPGLLINSDIQFEGGNLFQIRGISTISGNKQPLIVIDGYPTELSLDMIDPYEIESVTVLKDAAAATVYGVRASNGVIIIERKQAKAGKIQVGFRSTLGFTPKEDFTRYRWDKDGSRIAVDYAKMKNVNFPGTFWRDMQGPSGGYYGQYDPAAQIMIHGYSTTDPISTEERDRQLNELASYNNSADYSRLFLRTGATQTYNLNMSGGNERVLYYLTGNYSRMDATQRNNSNDQYRLSGRTTLKLSPKLSLELTTDLQKSTSNTAPLPNINDLYTYERLQDQSGNPAPVFRGSNSNYYYSRYMISRGLLDNMYYPLVDMNEINNNNTTLTNRVTTTLRYDLGKGFNVNLGGVYEYAQLQNKHLATANSSEARQLVNRYTKDGPTAGSLIYNIPRGGLLKQQLGSTEGITFRGQLNYDKRIATDHSLNLILGGEIRDVLSKSNNTAFFGYDDNTLNSQAVDYNIISNNFSPTYATSVPQITYDGLFSQQHTEDRFLSAYANAVYSFKEKYSLSGSVRIDQSNLFGTDPKYKYKPLWSLGAGWNIDQEEFLRNRSWLRTLKLRAAYGFNGNVAKNSLPQVIAQERLNNLNIYPPIPSLNLISFANSGLRWEQTKNFNAGLDYAFGKGITGNIDYYVKTSTDILATTQIDASKGAVSALINQSSIRNKGFEISLHADWISRRKLNWNTGLVISRNTGKVLKVYDPSMINPTISSYFSGQASLNYQEGYPVGTVFAARYAGLSNTGDVLIYDKDGNKKAFTAPGNGRNEVYAAGSSIPAFSLGLSNRVDVGDFYFSCMINYYAKFAVRIPVPDPTSFRPLEGSGNYWKKAGDEANPDILPAITKPSAYFYMAYTDRNTVNGSYVTLGDLTASYNLSNSRLFKKSKLINPQIRAQASNIYTIGFNKFNYSQAMGSYAKTYLTPTYTVELSVNF